MHSSICLTQQITIRVFLLLLWTVLLFCQHTGFFSVQCLSCAAPILNMQLIPWVSFWNTAQRDKEGEKSKRSFCDWQDSYVMCLAKADLDMFKIWYILQAITMQPYKKLHRGERLQVRNITIIKKFSNTSLYSCLGKEILSGLDCTLCSRSPQYPFSWHPTFVLLLHIQLLASENYP